MTRLSNGWQTLTAFRLAKHARGSSVHILLLKTEAPPKLQDAERGHCIPCLSVQQKGDRDGGEEGGTEGRREAPGVGWGEASYTDSISRSSSS